MKTDYFLLTKIPEMAYCLILSVL